MSRQYDTISSAESPESPACPWRRPVLWATCAACSMLIFASMTSSTQVFAASSTTVPPAVTTSFPHHFPVRALAEQGRQLPIVGLPTRSAALEPVSHFQGTALHCLSLACGAFASAAAAYLWNRSKSVGTSSLDHCLSYQTGWRTASLVPVELKKNTVRVPKFQFAMMATSAKKVTGIKSPVFSETCDQTGITLTRFMLEVARANPELQELESVFAAIQTACKTISKLVKRAAIDGMTGLQAGGGAVNVQGEEQKKLDVITNDVLKRALKFTGRMGVIASEEEDVPVEVDNTMDASYGTDVLVEESGGRYISVFDPLDGSSNVDAGIPVGTIFGIFAEDDDCKLSDDFFEGQGNISEAMKGCLRSTLKPGTSLVAAGYCLYSSGTHFVFTLGAGVNGFTLDESIGEFILTHPNITLPPRGKIYSVNEANREIWDAPMQEWIKGLGTGNNRGKKSYTSRYIGSMVGDVHRTLLYGGVFGYPADKKNVNGKLRLLYEAAPMSFLIEQAGGKSTTGMVRVMDIPPNSVHQRVPVVMGGTDEIDELEEFYQRLADEKLKESQLARLKI